MATKRSIAICIILCFITCGIYALYWKFCLAEEVRRVTQDDTLPGGAAVILFSLITCGIYAIYWYYRMGSAVNEVRMQSSLPPDDSRTWLFLLLAILQLPIVNDCLIQDDLNRYMDFRGY